MKTARMRRLRAGESGLLRERAALDGHDVLFPTHVVEKGGEVVGYVSVGSVPVVNWWMDSKATSARDSLAVLAAVETVIDEAGGEFYFMPCRSSSPYHGLMGRAGFENLGETDLHLRRIGG